MEQLSLPIKSHLLYKVFKWISALFIVGVIAFGMLYFIFIYSKDRLADLLPSDTELYISTRKPDQAEVNKLLDIMDTPTEFNDAVNEVLNNFDVTSKNRIFSFALVPSNGQLSKVVMLEYSGDSSPLVLALASKYNWHVYKATANYGNNSARLILSSDQGVLDRIKEVVDKKTPSLTSNLNIKLAITETLQHFGTLYITRAGFDELLSIPTQNELIVDPVVFGIKNFYPEFVAVAGGYVGDQVIKMHKNSDFKVDVYNLRDVRSTIKDIGVLDNLKSGLGGEYDEFIDAFSLKSFHFEKGNSQWLVDLQLADLSDELKFRHIFTKILDYKYLKTEKDVLPDKSEVVVKRVNNIKIDLESGQVEVPDHGISFNYKVTEDVIRISNFDNEQIIEPFTLCNTNIRSNTITISGNQLEVKNKWLKLVEYLTYTQYPQTYPQLMLCATYQKPQ